MGDAPIEPRYREMMNALAGGIDEILNGEGVKGKDRKVGFVLGVFNFGDDDKSRFNYISNADRADIVVLLKEMVARFEGQPEIKGHG